MKILSVIIILIISFESMASENVCITDYRVTEEQAMSFSMDEFIHGDEYVHPASLTCQEVGSISNGLKAVSITMQAGAIGLACSGVGLGASLYLEGGVVLFSVADLIITNLDCDDSANDQKVKELVDIAVCEAMNEQGVECLPPIQQNLI